MKIIKKIDLEPHEKLALHHCYNIWYDFRAHCNNDCDLCIFNGLCNNAGDIERAENPLNCLIDNMSERI